MASRRARACSEKYADWLRYTLSFLVDAEAEFPAAPGAFEAVLAGLGERSAATKRDVWSAMRMLSRWVAKRYGLAFGMEDVVRPRRKKTVPTGLKQLQIERLLWVKANRGLREQALLRFLLDTGARIGEALNLTIDDIDGDDQDGFEVLLDGKTGQRLVPMTPETAEKLIDLHRRGELPWRGKRGELTLGGLQKRVRCCLRNAGIDGGPHLLRRTFGTHFIRNGGDVLSLQRIFGHASLEVTMQYVGLALGDVKVKHARFSPMAASWAVGAR